ncbi:hypothetical protein DL98DRAFT_523965 [Cadophora sp. DSE1049]|nr:hypothetical protein DL98DRAFT_523965 [Cadophora sp. DSE1049]
MRRAYSLRASSKSSRLIGNRRRLFAYSNSKTLVGYYLDNMSNINSAVVFLGLEPWRDLIEDFRSASLRRTPNLQQRLRRGFTDLGEQIDNLSAQIKAATASRPVSGVRALRTGFVPQRPMTENHAQSNHRDLYYDFLPGTSQHNLEYFKAFYGGDAYSLFSFHQDVACQEQQEQQESVVSSPSVDALLPPIPQRVPYQHNLVHPLVQSSPQPPSQVTSRSDRVAPILSPDFPVAPSSVIPTSISPQPQSSLLVQDKGLVSTSTHICLSCERHFQAASVLRQVYRYKTKVVDGGLQSAETLFATMWLYMRTPLDTFSAAHWKDVTSARTANAGASNDLTTLDGIFGNSTGRCWVLSQPLETLLTNRNAEGVGEGCWKEGFNRWLVGSGRQERSWRSVLRRAPGVQPHKLPGPFEDRSCEFRYERAGKGYKEDVEDDDGDEEASGSESRNLNCLLKLIHSSSYGSNYSGPRTEKECGHVEIPISNYLVHTCLKLLPGPYHFPLFGLLKD